MSGTDDPMRGPRDQAMDDVPEEVREAWAKLGAAEPPDLVDLAVLNRARAAVERPRSGRPWSFGWMHTLTTTAVLVLGVTVLMQFREPAPSLPETRPAPQGAAPEREMDAPRASGTIDHELRRMSPEALDRVQGRNDAAAAAAGAAVPEAESAADEADLMSRKSESGEPAPLRLRDLAAPVEEAPPPSPAAAPAPIPMTAPEADAEEAKQAQPLQERQEVRDPDAWLEEIRALFAAGELDTARKQLEAFLAAYPDHPLPEDLQP